MEEELISIVVPVYKVEDYVEKCVRSIMAQDYKNLEILIVDDGTPDHSGEICDRLALEDSRISVFHTPNGGLSAARNVGIDHAHGEFIGFVDSDDWIEPDMYSFLYKTLKEHDADISVCSHYIDKGSKIKCKHKHNQLIVCDKDMSMNLLIKDKYLHNYAWDKLYRRTLFDGLHYPEGILYEDIAFTYKVVDRARLLVIHGLPKYHYTVRPGSIVSARYAINRNISYFNSEFILMNFMVEHGYKDGAMHLVRRGIHTIKRLIMSSATDDMLNDILERIRPFHYVGVKEIGLINVWRRWMLENHLQTYKSIYKFSKKIFK